MKRLLALAFLVTGCTAPKPERVIFWHDVEQPQSGAVLKRLVEEYNAKQNRIEVVPIMAGKQDLLLKTLYGAIANPDGPDIVWGYPALTAQLAESGTIIPLDSYLTSQDRAQIPSYLWAQTIYRGKTWGMPFDANCLALFYNRQHFKEAGIKPPTDWSEFQAAAKRLTRDLDGDGTPEQWGFLVPYGKEEWASWTWQALLYQAGGTLFDKGKPGFASQEGVAAINLWKGLVESRQATLSAPEKGAVPEPFRKGRVSMFISGPWSLAELPKELPYGVAKLPRGKKSATNIGGEALYLAKRGEPRQKLAWEFAQYLLSPEFQTKWAMETGYLPVTKAALKSEEYGRHLKRHPQLKVFLEALPEGHVRPSTPVYPMISETLGQGLLKALSGEKSPESALLEAQKTIELRLR